MEDRAGANELMLKITAKYTLSARNNNRTASGAVHNSVSFIPSLKPIFFTNHSHHSLFHFPYRSESTVACLLPVLPRLIVFLFLFSSNYFKVMIRCGRLS